MNETQRKAYLEDSSKCPFCQSYQIEGSSVEISNDRAYQTVSCNDCDKRWTDIYKLSDVEEVNHELQP